MGGRVTRAGGLLVAVVAGVLAAASVAGPASAHNSLTGSDPRDGARIASAPTQVALTFLAKLDPAGTRSSITGPDNIPAAGGAPAVSGSQVTLPFKPGAAGLYIVAYDVASADGHRVKGEVRFTLTVGVSPSPSAPAGSAAPPADPSPSGSPAGNSPAAGDTVPGSPAPSASPAADDDGGSSWPWVLGAVLVVAAAVGAALAPRRSRRRTG